MTVHLLANQGAIGGGETMLLRSATTLTDLGVSVEVVAPDFPDEVARAASEAGLATRRIGGDSRGQYAARLAAWSRRSDGLLWAHGLLPALATAGRGERIVHLHQLPTPRQRPAARIALRGARQVVVPSRFLAAQIPQAEVFANWTEELALVSRRPADGGSRVGALGRLSRGKGTDVLAQAVASLPESTELWLAGDDRFVPAAELRAVDHALTHLGDRVHRLGWVARAAFLSQIDTLAVPSTYPESFGLAAAEALGSGLPLVVSDAGALPEVVGPDHPWTVPARDVGALAEALRATLPVADPPADPDTRVADSITAGRLRWETEFSPTAGRARCAALISGWGLAAAP